MQTHGQPTRCAPTRCRSVQQSASGALSGLRGTTAQQVMHPRPRTIAFDALAVDAATLMEAHSITSVLVLDARTRLVGVVHIGDLMRAKVI